MNKKHARIIPAMIIVLSMIAGCGKETATYQSLQSDSKEGKQAESSASVTVSSAETDVPDTSGEIVEEESKTVNIKFSDYDFSKCFYASKDFFFVLNSDNLYVLTDIETGLPVDKTFTVSNENGTAEYPYAFSGLQDLPGGYLLCLKKTSDNEGLSVVFDKKTGEVVASYLGSTKILNYINGMVERAKTEDHTVRKVSLSTADQDIDDGYIVDCYGLVYLTERDGRIWFVDNSNMSAKIFNGEARTLEDNKTLVYSLDAKALRDAVENGKADTVTREELDYREHVSDDGSTLYILTSDTGSVSKDGWVYAYSEVQGSDGRIREDSGVFYNVKTGQSVKVGPFSEDCAVPSVVGKYDDTRRQVAEVNGIAVLQDYDSEIYEAYGTHPKRLFDINKGEYIGDEVYLNIGAFGDNDEPVLVRRMDGKWGYLDNNTKLPVGEFYDDASSFCNGYAIVINNGVGRLIDVNMNVVGEEFNAKSSYAIQTDYYSDSDLDGKSIFVVTMPGGEKRLLTVE